MDRLAYTLESFLARFLNSGSINLVESAVRYERRKKPNVVQLSIPNEPRAKEIRECWERDRRSIPRSGIVFPDGSVMTILFECCELPVPQALSSVADQITLIRDSAPYAYVRRYSYCFYPNSEAAEFIGYFRYDFHLDSMGDGDLGEHTYFHLHHRQVENGFRLTTGAVIEFDKLVSGIEGTLAPKTRRDRLQRLFDTGKFDELLFDLTVEGVKSMGNDAMSKRSQWKLYQHKAEYERFIDQHL